MTVKEHKEDELYEINIEFFFRGILNYIYKKKFLSIIFVFISLIIFSNSYRLKQPIFRGDFIVSLSDREKYNPTINIENYNPLIKIENENPSSNRDNYNPILNIKNYIPRSNFYKSSIERQILILSSEKSLKPLVDYYNQNPLKKKYILKDFSYAEFFKLIRFKPEKSNTQFLRVEFISPNKTLLEEMLFKIHERFDEIIVQLHQEDIQKLKNKYQKLIKNQEISIDESIKKVNKFLIKKDISSDQIIINDSASTRNITDPSKTYKPFQYEINIDVKKLNLVDIFEFSKLRNDYYMNLHKYNNLQEEIFEFTKQYETINNLQIFKKPTIQDLPINKSRKDFYLPIFIAYLLSLFPYKYFLKIKKY